VVTVTVLVAVSVTVTVELLPCTVVVCVVVLVDVLLTVVVTVCVHPASIVVMMHDTRSNATNFFFMLNTPFGNISTDQIEIGCVYFQVMLTDECI
jgi:hypothetical protein